MAGGDPHGMATRDGNGMAKARDDDQRSMRALDAFMFRGDEDPRTRSLLTVAYVLDQSPGREEFVAAFDRASRLIQRLRQHVVAPPLPVFLPSWIVDPDFDLERHLRFARLPAPGGLADLMDAVQAELVTHLDPARPLWEAILYEGLEGERAAVIIKMSHAVTDGIGALKLFTALLDTERHPDKGPLPPAPIPEDVTPDELLERAVRGLPAATLRTLVDGGTAALRVALQGAAAPRATATGTLEYLRSLGRMFGPHGAPSPALAGRSLARRAIALEWPLEVIRRAARKLEGSVNDLYLAGTVGALRRYHEAVGQPVESLPMAIPVNLRDAGDAAEGNRFGAILLAAPVGEADPRERVRRIREAVRAGRAEPAIDAMGRMAPLLARLPGVALQSLAASSPKPDIQASNLPGPEVPIYLAGARIAHSYAFGPVPGAAAMLTLQSLAGTCFVGVNVDPAAFTRPELLADCLQQGFAEMLAFGGRKQHVGTPLMGRTRRRRKRA